VTALARLAPASLAVLDSLREIAAKVADVADVIDLEDPDQARRAALLLQACETKIREAEKARKADKAPHLAAGKQVDAEFAGPVGEIERVAGLLRRRIAERATRVRLEQERAVREARDAALRGDAVAANAALAVAPDTTTLAGVAETWGWEAVGFELGRIPVEFLAVDMTKVKAYAAECARTGAEPSVPGITFERKTSLRVRSL
jgi:hypothetical protein